MNPKNGICLSSLYDKAFDQGLISFPIITMCYSHIASKKTLARSIFHSILSQ